MNLKKLGPPLIPRPSKPNWILKNHGALDGELNMSIDQNALDDLTTGHRESPILRLFEWAKPTITYGYLLDLEKVKRWAEDFEKAPIIKRPTGGGAVFHKTSDLSLSFLWPRKKGVLPENPRDCYKKIHALLKEGVEKYLTRGTKLLSLYSSPPCLPAGRQVGEGREGGVVSPLIDKSKDEQHPAPYPRPPACRQAGKGRGIQIGGSYTRIFVEDLMLCLSCSY